jgi:hypothetical protein
MSIAHGLGCVVAPRLAQETGSAKSDSLNPEPRRRPFPGVIDLVQNAAARPDYLAPMIAPS